MDAAVVMALANTKESTTCRCVSFGSRQVSRKTPYAYAGDVWLGSIGTVAVVPGDVVEDDLRTLLEG